MPTILIAEDNPSISRVICFNMKRAGFETFAAANGKIAWDAANAHTYDMVLTDQQMPLMTGLELTEKLRTLPAYNNVPIIMLTAKGFELEVETLKEELGIACVYAKPFSPSQLVKTVEGLLAAVV